MGLDVDVETYLIPGFKIFEHFFTVPLDHDNPSGVKIRLFARQGGPGFECSLPSYSGAYRAASAKGYQWLLLDQRGTGLSTPISAASLGNFETAEAKADYLKYFRADSIVKDAELIRRELCGGRKWSLLGQSFGGFCCINYLSLFTYHKRIFDISPNRILPVFITGGVPPLASNPDPVYRSLYCQLIKRNSIYYLKYPKDIQRVRTILRYLSTNTIILPDGGFLTPRRFRQLGIAFGEHGGFDAIHQIVILTANDIEAMGGLSYRCLEKISNRQPFDSNILYAILHEAIYCQGEKSNWSAERNMTKDFYFSLEWLETNEGKPVLFTGEMIYSWMFDDYAELRPLKEVAQLLAQYEDWGPLYDVEQLGKNNVPVAGVSYYEDMYVDLKLSEETVSKIKGFRHWITNEYQHNGLREGGEHILNTLFRMLRGDYDGYNESQI
ncbi:10163_t:CDS:2 [Paraglomus brasilianum]|uniref:10163_t:CDS:1 n=1 Tax=Paraglomus brasilianum TaxID=144538 RepID=A0A9N9GUD3_9GLOM|nr:10163_t:CDS:2 [Paraglomus brasilianum]